MAQTTNATINGQITGIHAQTAENAPPNAASREKGLFRYAPEPLLPRNNHILILIRAPCYSVTVVYFCSALET
jgi:hypothetical protein